MRVVTWNIQHGRRHDTHQPDPVALAAECVALDADVLALQEVDRRTRRVHGADLLEIVADATRLTPVDGPATHFDGGTYGNALLVRGDPVAPAVLVLPRHRHRSEPRSLVRCRFAGLTVATCHLDNGMDAAAQLGVTLGALPAAGPAVLAGDLNLPPGSVDAVISAVGPGWSQVEVAMAFPARAPDRTIDHVLVREMHVVAALPSEPRPLVSDHRPVAVELDWPLWGD